MSSPAPTNGPARALMEADDLDDLTDTLERYRCDSCGAQFHKQWRDCPQCEAGTVREEGGS